MKQLVVWAYVYVSQEGAMSIQPVKTVETLEDAEKWVNSLERTHNPAYTEGGWYKCENTMIFQPDGKFMVTECYFVERFVK